jgi:chemotaxis family two-component system response regulator Rcp1
MQLLLVEDNPADVRLMQEILHAAGLPCSLWVVGDGEQALTFLRHEGAYEQAPRPDVIVLDLNLPRLSGWELLTALQQEPRWQSIPALVLSGSLAEDDREQAAQRGAWAYFCKPNELEGYWPFVHALQQYRL